MDEIKRYIICTKKIDREGIRSGRNMLTYDLIHEENPYPPKLVISIANRF
jgi:hypothetical protein